MFQRFRSRRLDEDGNVGIVDLASFVAQWMQSNCGDCGGADIAGNDASVNFEDFVLFSLDWMDAKFLRYE